MSNKNPMKFLPPDDPTAVYPIRTSAESDDEPEADAPDVSDVDTVEDTPDDDNPLPQTFEFADETTAPRSTPVPSSTPRLASSEGTGLNPLLLIAFLGGGIVLASVVLLALAAVLFFLQ